MSKIKVKCDNCGNIIERKASHAKRVKHNFCCSDCYHQWQSKELRGEKSTNWKGGKVKVVCDNCGKTIEKSPRQIKKDKHHFCNISCHAQWQCGHTDKEESPVGGEGKRREYVRYVKRYFMYTLGKSN